VSKSKSYIENQVKWINKHFSAEFKAVRQAVQEVKQTYAGDKASANEFRGQLKDQAGTFATKAEVAVLTKFMYMAMGAFLVINFIGITGIILFLKYFK